MIKPRISGLIFLTVLALTLTGFYLLANKHNKPKESTQPVRETVLINGQEFSVDIADTPEEQQMGLSGRAALGARAGMLFVYDKTDMSCFWMKDMKFDIDILWFDQDKKLIHQKMNASPAAYPETFCTPVPAQYVVELAAGTAERYNFKNGDELIISNNVKQ